MTAILVPLLAVLAATPAPVASTPVPAVPVPSPEALEVARATMPPAVWAEMMGPALEQARSAVAAKLLEAHIAAPPAMLDEVTDVIREALSYDAFIGIYARSLGGIYTTAELEGLAAFYRSDLGKRLVATTPLLQRRVVDESAAFMQSRMTEVEPRLVEILRRHMKVKG